MYHSIVNTHTKTHAGTYTQARKMSIPWPAQKVHLRQLLPHYPKWLTIDTNIPKRLDFKTAFYLSHFRAFMKVLDGAVVVGVPHKAAIKIKLIPKTFPTLCAKIVHHYISQT